MIDQYGVDMVEERLNLYQTSSMKIGIIGAGEIGGTLTRRFTALGHHVSVANSEVLGASLNWPQRPARSPYRLPKRPGAEKWSS